MPTEEEEVGAAKLLEHLREVTGVADIEYVSFPKPLTGGMSGASIFGFELVPAPPGFEGPLVLRVATGDATEQRCEAALQMAAGELGCRVARVRLIGGDDVFGTGFFIMERLAGATLYRWFYVSWLAALVALVLGQPWVAAACLVLGSAASAIPMGMLARSLHQLDLDDVKRIYSDKGVQDAEADIAHVLHSLNYSIEGGGMDEYRVGQQWVIDNAVVPVRPGLCHGDMHPGNCMATWTRTTGLIDWESACIADPEFDVACMAFVTVLVPWVLPIHWFYVAYMRAHGGVDRDRLRYYEALKCFMAATHWTRGLVEGQRNGSTTGVGPALGRYAVRRCLRRFCKLSGVDISLLDVVRGP